ncbi:MAG: ABC transporter permease [Dehalococcoidia bacterium]|nr:ABC transporter permease [Dehalococcoidia bacterium]
MTAYIIRRLLLTAPVVVLLSVIIFVVLYVMPGDVALAVLGQFASPAELAAMREKLGLDRPAVVQYLSWAGKIFKGDFGTSFFYGEGVPVLQTILQRLPVSLQLGASAIVLGIALGLPLGIIAALRRNSLIDLGVTSFAVSGLAMPSFWMAILLILLFAVRLDWLPPSGFVPFAEDPIGNLRHLALPAFVLGVDIAAVVARLVRSEMLEVLGQDYVRTARSKGLREHVVVLRHVLRNALIPVVTLLGLLAGRLVSGSVIIETIFALPGVGQLTVSSLFNRDLPLVQATLFLITMGVVFGNLLVDLAYGYLDPRIRHA